MNEKTLSAEEECAVIREATSCNNRNNNDTLYNEPETMSFDASKNTAMSAEKYRLKSSSVSSSQVPTYQSSKVLTRRAACLKRKREMLVGSSSSDEESQRFIRSTRRRRVVTAKRSACSRSLGSASDVKKSCSDTTSVHDNNDDDDEVKVIKVGKAPVCKTTDSMNISKANTYTSPSNNCSLTSTSTTSNIRGIECLGFVSPSPPFSQQHLCTHCGNRGYACHNKVYSTYCTKACLHYLQHNTDGWLAGFDPNTMEQTFIKAYNEKRRVELEENHGYFCPNHFVVPQCMRNDLMKHAINLGDNPRLCSDLEMHNVGGRQRWNEAKKNYRG